VVVRFVDTCGIVDHHFSHLSDALGFLLYKYDVKVMLCCTYLLYEYDVKVMLYYTWLGTGTTMYVW
jgi:hypothetical protein